MARHSPHVGAAAWLCPPGPAPGARPLAGHARLALVSTCMGVFLPLLPATPLLLAAAWAAARSSAERHAWLYRHPRFGPLLRDWRDHRALRRRTKTVALLVVLSWLVMIATVGT